MKKIAYVFVFALIVLTCTCCSFLVAAPVPRLAIKPPSSGTVEIGGTIRYEVVIYSATNVTLNPSNIRIAGVRADISVEGSGNNSRTIVLSNIQGSVGSIGYISYIAGGVATNGSEKSIEMNITSTPFTIVATVSQEPTPQPPVQEPEQQPEPLPPNNPQQNPEGNNNNNENPNEENPEEPKEEEDTTRPEIQLTELSKKRVKVGEEISFDVIYTDNKEMGDITLEKKDFTLYGFTADIKIDADGNKRRVTLSNIQGMLGGMKYVKIASKTAKDKAGNLVNGGAVTEYFKIYDNDTRNKADDWIENPNTGR